MATSALPEDNISALTALHLIDIDSPWIWGVAREATKEEKQTAELHGRFDDPMMSVLGVTSEGVAGVMGKPLATLFASSPEMLVVLDQIRDMTSGESEDPERDLARIHDLAAAMILKATGKEPS